MAKRIDGRVALTVAGSDSGGGAGIQADLKTFASLGIHGVSAVTAITAQNPIRVRRVEPVKPAMILEQLEAVFEAFTPGAVKIGMLYSASNMRAVAEFFGNRQGIPIVLDPVMVSTSGTPLLDRTALLAMRKQLLPLVRLITPNVHECRVLTGTEIRTPEDLRSAARAIHGMFGGAVLVKGGHLREMSDALDVLYDGRDEWLLSARFRKGIQTHGTGCTYSAAIAAYLARGCKLQKAVELGKNYITHAIATSTSLGRFMVLNYRPPA